MRSFRKTAVNLQESTPQDSAGARQFHEVNATNVSTTKDVSHNHIGAWILQGIGTFNSICMSTNHDV